MKFERLLKLTHGFLLLLGMHSAGAVLIDHFDHAYDGGSVEIALDVFDNGGIYSWEYTVTNNSYDPNPGATNGFSGFELFLPSPIPEIGDIVPNPSSTPPWEHNCCSGLPMEWDIRNSVGLGVMPGEFSVFSFTTDPRAVAINNNGWFHSWESDGQVGIVPTLGMHVPLVPGLDPIDPEPVPEPGSGILFAVGLAGLACWKRRLPN